MTCPKCGSSNVNCENVSNVNSKGGNVPIWYWLSIICPVIDMCLCMFVIGFFGFTIHHFLKRRAKRTKTNVESYAICQDCGNNWKIKN